MELSLSNRGQVLRKVVLYRIDGKRLYASGIYNYQGIPKEERPYLLINGEVVVELGFSALHGNLLLNRVNEPSCRDFYERILTELRVAPTKQMTNASFNVNSIRGYAGC